MKINYLKVKINSRSYQYNFDSKNLIYSKANSKGKTTLLRFILYAIGYQIPATEGIGEFDKMSFEINIENQKKIIVYREAENVKVLIDGNIAQNYILPLQETELFTLILFCWLFGETLGLTFRVTWGLAKVAAIILFVLALPTFIGVLLLAGGFILLVPVALVGAAFGILKACV